MAAKKVLVIDVDGTIAEMKKGKDYRDLKPNHLVVRKIKHMKELGWRVALYTSRNMRSYDNNIGLINANTAPVLIEWLKLHDIPYDELYFGKPWCGHDGYYVDDRAIRPREFATMSEEEIAALIARDAEV